MRSSSSVLVPNPGEHTCISIGCCDHLRRRRDGAGCHPQIASVCKSLYAECTRIMYNRTFVAQIYRHVVWFLRKPKEWGYGFNADGHYAYPAFPIRSVRRLEIDIYVSLCREASG